MLAPGPGQLALRLFFLALLRWHFFSNFTGTKLFFRFLHARSNLVGMLGIALQLLCRRNVNSVLDYVPAALLPFHIDRIQIIGGALCPY